MIQDMMYFFDDAMLSTLVGFLAGALVAAGLFYLLRRSMIRRLATIEQRIEKLDKEVGPLRERSKAQLSMLKHVVFGIDDIVHNVKQSIEEEERKLHAIAADHPTDGSKGAIVKQGSGE